MKRAKPQVGGKLPDRLENSVQASVIAYLCFRPDFMFFRNNVGGFAPKSGGFIKYGAVGSADIIGVLAPLGTFVAIECKRSVGGVLTDDQRVWGENVMAHGGMYVVANDLQVVIDALGEASTRVVKQTTRQRTYPRGGGK